jgi:hypothetical protein
MDEREMLPDDDVHRLARKYFGPSTAESIPETILMYTREIERRVAACRTTPDRECEWKCDDIDNSIWESSCGESWSFVDGGPVENRMLFCHRCGSKLKTAPASDQGEKS